VFRDGDADWLVFHAYDAHSNGVPHLRVAELVWDDEGWPAPLAPA
jgi:arabinan endo-1,5-alpha-L-arabinosidase